jgi:hypothetical protein
MRVPELGEAEPASAVGLDGALEARRREFMHGTSVTGITPPRRIPDEASEIHSLHA